MIPPMEEEEGDSHRKGKGATYDGGIPQLNGVHSIEGARDYGTTKRFATTRRYAATQVPQKSTGLRGGALAPARGWETLNARRCSSFAENSYVLEGVQETLVSLENLTE